MSEPLIRKARPADAPVIAHFNTAMALETEGRRLDPERATAGAQRLFDDPSLGFYLVAELDGEVAASLMITNEWSDWRNAQFWWIQSVYVRPDLRRRGIFRALYDALRRAAQADPGVCGFRLYVDQDNAPAMATYEALGMEATAYRMFEELKAGVNWFRP